MANRTTERASDEVKEKKRFKRGRDYLGDFKISIIPEDVERKFKKEGFLLRWIRVRIEGGEDLDNVYNSFRRGYDFVTHDELDGTSWEGLFQEFDSRHSESPLVMYKDVALARITEAANAQYKKQVAEKTDAQNAFIQQIEGSKVYNSSKQTVTRGRHPKFNDD